MITEPSNEWTDGKLVIQWHSCEQWSWPSLSLFGHGGAPHHFVSSSVLPGRHGGPQPAGFVCAQALEAEFVAWLHELESDAQLTAEQRAAAIHAVNALWLLYAGTGVWSGTFTLRNRLVLFAELQMNDYIARHSIPANQQQVVWHNG